MAFLPRKKKTLKELLREIENIKINGDIRGLKI